VNARLIGAIRAADAQAGFLGRHDGAPSFGGRLAELVEPRRRRLGPALQLVEAEVHAPPDSSRAAAQAKGWSGTSELLHGILLVMGSKRICRGEIASIIQDTDATPFVTRTSATPARPEPSNDANGWEQRPVNASATPAADRELPLRDLFWYFLKLGWLAFGGPVGQIGMMHLQVVEQRRWIDEDEFVRAINFCHILPGPEALQLVIYLGWKKRGYLGGIVAGLLFIVPGFLTLTALAWIYVHHGKRPEVLGILSGFRPVGLALLLAALVRISRATLKGAFPVALAALAFLAFFVLGLPFLLVLLGCGVLFIAWQRIRRRSKAAVAASLVLLLPAAASAAESAWSRLVDVSSFFLKVGLFSFGGAYAVLPFIREGSVLTYGWMTDPQMIDALALGETTPGPLISIGTFVGYLAGHGQGVGLLGAVASTFWLFLPSFVFVLGAAKHMLWLTSKPGVKEFLKGVTCGVVGLMFSISIPLAKVAFMPQGRIDWLTVVLGLAAFAAMTFWKWRLTVVVVVLGGGLLGLGRALLLALA
jgi:chromate transporter